MRPTTIQLHCLHPSSSVSDVVVRKIRWLQAWHKQGRLQQVTELDMDEKVPLTDRMQITQFSGSIITYAGLWNLQICSLAGPFCIRLAADVLPSSLQELSLRPQQGPVHLPLSAFQRFTHLQSLKLAYRAFYKMGAAAVQEDMLHPAIFVFNQCFMGSLRTLDLLSLSHSSDDIDLRCCTTEDFSVDKCLPNLTSLIAGIYYQPKSVSIHAWCTIASQSGLQHLQLEVIVTHQQWLAPDTGIVINNNANLVIALQKEVCALSWYEALNRAGIVFHVQLYNQ